MNYWSTNGEDKLQTQTQKRLTAPDTIHSILEKVTVCQLN